MWIAYPVKESTIFKYVSNFLLLPWKVVIVDLAFSIPLLISFGVQICFLHSWNLICNCIFHFSSVDIMKKKLDSENLGIILLPAFMEEFFPEETVNIPDTFTLYHYNGLIRSCPNKKVSLRSTLYCGHFKLLVTYVILPTRQLFWEGVD